MQAGEKTVKVINITELFLKQQKKNMTNDELATTIREFIKTNYQATYNGLLEVESLSEGGYKLILGIPSYMAQTQIACNVDDQDTFLEFIYSELLMNLKPI